MRRLVPFALLAVALVAGPSSADDPCAGTEEGVLVCVHPEGAPGVDPDGDYVGRCVTVGAPPCHKVTVPVPTVTPGDGQPPVTVGGKLCDLTEAGLC